MIVGGAVRGEELLLLRPEIPASGENISSAGVDAAGIAADESADNRSISFD